MPRSTSVAPCPLRSNLLPRRTGLSIETNPSIRLDHPRTSCQTIFGRTPDGESTPHQNCRITHTTSPLHRPTGGYLSHRFGFRIMVVYLSSAGEESGVTSPEWRDIYAYRRPQLGYQETIHFNDLTPIEIGSTLDRIRFDVRRKWENQR